jgi:hypothetical protein
MAKNTAVERRKKNPIELGKKGFQQINSECQIVAKGNLFTNCTNGIPVPDIKNHGNLYGTIVNIYINNFAYIRSL